MTKQNPDKMCDGCRKFDHMMNRDGSVSHDVFVQCNCCEDCIKLTDAYLEANPSKRGRVMCIPCHEASKEHFVYIKTYSEQTEPCEKCSNERVACVCMSEDDSCQ